MKTAFWRMWPLVLVVVTVVALASGFGASQGMSSAAGSEFVLENSPPYPRSAVLAGVTWADKQSIVRLAKGSDNWPLTWADDGNLYTTPSKTP